MLFFAQLCYPAEDLSVQKQRPCGWVFFLVFGLGFFWWYSWHKNHKEYLTGNSKIVLEPKYSGILNVMLNFQGRVKRGEVFPTGCVGV